MAWADVSENIPWLVFDFPAKDLNRVMGKPQLNPDEGTCHKVVALRSSNVKVEERPKNCSTLKETEQSECKDLRAGSYMIWRIGKPERGLSIR